MHVRRARGRNSAFPGALVNVIGEAGKTMSVLWGGADASDWEYKKTDLFVGASGGKLNCTQGARPFRGRGARAKRCVPGQSLGSEMAGRRRIKSQTSSWGARAPFVSALRAPAPPTQAGQIQTNTDTVALRTRRQASFLFRGWPEEGGQKDRPLLGGRGSADAAVTCRGGQLRCQ